MEQRAIAVGAIALAIVCGGAGLMLYRRAQSDPGPRPTPSALGFVGDTGVHVPSNVRIKVEVLNTTHVRGLARQATFYLRDRGFDVVGVGTTAEEHDTTVVLDRSHHADWARLAVRALGRARVGERPDSSRYVDLTVLLGATWRPPAEPFYP